MDIMLRFPFTGIVAVISNLVILYIMELINILENSKWLIFAVLVLIVLLASVAGRISPKFSLLLITLLLIVISFINPPTERATFYDQDMTAVDTAATEQVPNEEKMRKEKVPPEGRENERRVIPDEYEVKDERLRTYLAEGNWEWTPDFLEAVKRETGWTDSRKGNYTISIDYEESFTQNMDDQARVFVNSGGVIEITVNGLPCCCDGRLTIPKGLSAASMGEMQELLQQTVSKLIHDHQQSIIRDIRDCL
jgi:hypothetical protein